MYAKGDSLVIYRSGKRRLRDDAWIKQEKLQCIFALGVYRINNAAYSRALFSIDADVWLVLE
jgi:hypothetical protein